VLMPVTEWANPKALAYGTRVHNDARTLSAGGDFRAEALWALGAISLALCINFVPGNNGGGQIVSLRC